MKNLLSRIDPRLHIVVRVWLQTVVIVLLAMVGFVLVVNVVLQDLFLNQSLRQAETSTSVTATALDDTYGQLLSGFIEACGTEDFEKLLAEMINAGPENEVQLNINLQTLLSSLNKRSSLTSSVFIVTRNGTVFKQFGQKMTQDTVAMNLDYRSVDFHGITLLPLIHGPVRGEQNVLCLAFPLRILDGTNLTAIAPDYDSTQAVLYMTCDVDAFNNYLQTYADRGLCGTMYLLSADGKPLNRDSDNNTGLLREAVEEGLFSGSTAGTLQVEQQYMCWQYLESMNLYVVNLISRG